MQLQGHYTNVLNAIRGAYFQAKNILCKIRQGKLVKRRCPLNLEPNPANILSVKFETRLALRGVFAVYVFV